MVAGDGRRRRAARIGWRLAAASCVLFVVAAVMLFWLTLETDSGMYCSGNATPGPAACAVYDAWSIPFVLSVAAAVGAVVAWIGAALSRS